MIENLPLPPLRTTVPQWTTGVTGKQSFYNVAMFPADCSRGEKLKYSQFFFNLLLWKKYFKFFFVENMAFILCKHFFLYTETCQHISLLIAFKRKNVYIFGLKSVEIYIAVMGKINLLLIMVWYLSLISEKKFWHVNITYMYVFFTLRKQKWLLF